MLSNSTKIVCVGGVAFAQLSNVIDRQTNGHESDVRPTLLRSSRPEMFRDRDCIPAKMWTMQADKFRCHYHKSTA
jgi:hypothetical protein